MGLALCLDGVVFGAMGRRSGMVGDGRGSWLRFGECGEVGWKRLLESGTSGIVGGRGGVGMKTVVVGSVRVVLTSGWDMMDVPDRRRRRNGLEEDCRLGRGGGVGEERDSSRVDEAFWEEVSCWIGGVDM